MLHRLGRKLTLLNLLISGAILMVMAFVVLAFSERTLAEKYEEDLAGFVDTALMVLLSNSEENATQSVYVQSGASYIVARQDAEHELHLLTTSDVDLDQLQEVSLGLRENLESPLWQSEAYTIQIRMDDAVAQEETPLFLTMEEGSMVKVASASDDAVVQTESEMQIGQWGSVSITSTISDVQEDDPAESETDAIAFETALSDDSVASVFFFSATQVISENTTLDGTPYRMLATMVYGEEDAPDTLLPPGSMLVILQDRTEEIRSRNQQRWMFSLLIVGGLGLIFLSSRFLSSRSIRPIETSIRQQREFVAAASHELRTPIAAIRANAEVLEDAELSETFSPFLQSIESEGQRMTRLVGDLIDLARADAGEGGVMTVPVRLRNALSEVAQLMRPLYEKAGLTLHEEDVPDACLQADPGRLRQVLLVLLDNALHYTPAGGEIWLRAHTRMHHVTIRVEDSGIGIDDEIKPRIFDRFFRADAARSRSHQGAGLGLSVAQQWTQIMQGSISVEDRPGGGTVFILRFPLAKSEDAGPS